MNDKPQTDDTPAITLSMDQLQALIATAVQSAQQGAQQPAGNLGDLAKAITTGMQSVREPIPENKRSPEISVYNPLGDRDFPRPGLKCALWGGVIADEKDDATRKVAAAWELNPGTLTVWEQLAINLLEPWEGRIRMMDGAPTMFKVQALLDGNGKMIRLVLGFEKSLISKKDGDVARRGLLPPITEICRQITHVNLSPDVFGITDETGLFTFHGDKEREQLIALMAAHKAGRYVSSLEAAA